LAAVCTFEPALSRSKKLKGRVKYILSLSRLSCLSFHYLRSLFIVLSPHHYIASSIMVSSANNNPKTLTKQLQRVIVLAAVDDLFSDKGMQLEDQYVFIQNKFHGITHCLTRNHRSTCFLLLNSHLKVCLTPLTFRQTLLLALNSSCVSRSFTFRVSEPVAKNNLPTA
jgi:hypothetical protein